MKENKHGYSSVEFVLVLCLLLIFTFGALLLIKDGSGLYKRMLDRKDHQTDIRIASAYLNNKLRQGDRSEGIVLADLNGKKAIVVGENVSGEKYSTWIFVENGYLREALAADGTQPTIDTSFEIVPIKGMSARNLTGKSLEIELEGTSGEVIHLIYHIKSEREVGTDE